MEGVLSILRAGLLVAEAGLTLLVGYLLMLTVAALAAPRRTPPRDGPPGSRFLILVPAHDEEKLIAQTVASLRGLDYPDELRQVHVVADNCADRTAELARAAGAFVHERSNPDLRGKGYALEWLLEEIRRAGIPHDAAVILDADTVVSGNFLRVMDARLARGERAIQAYYAVRDPGRSWTVSLRFAALAVLHYLRPLGRATLGGSAGLKGNGMVFAADLMRTQRWSASLTEDIEYHMGLVLAGERVTFAPDAVAWAEMPDTLASSRSQNVRWERGRQQMLRQYAPRLLREAARRRSFVLFDAAVEQIIPPFSVLVGLCGACLLAGLLLGSAAGAAWGAALLLGQAVYTLTGLALAGAPRKVYAALAYAPALVLWKMWLYARVTLGLDRQGWTRTARNK
jgi:cellulose synthase/poly-beta-1,6-N-acetylglucosamine synthase-like glycosyltransferase